MTIVASILAATLSPLLRRIPLRPLPEATAPTGLAIRAAGLAVRIWSMRTLRASYSRTLRTETEQPVVDRDPDRLVRHPGYLGSPMTWTGFARTSRSLSVAITVAGLLARAYSRRITAEEALLRRELPGYLDYIGRRRSSFRSSGSWPDIDLGVAGPAGMRDLPSSRWVHRDGDAVRCGTRRTCALTPVGRSRLCGSPRSPRWRR